MVDSFRNRTSWDDRDRRDRRDDRPEPPEMPLRRERPGDDWDSPPRRSYRRPEPRLEQRLDQWMTAGRQLVDGVAGARPGSRPSSARAAGTRAGSRLRPGDLGRWVEDKLDWLLEDDEGWREPWQERQPARPERPRAGAAPADQATGGSVGGRRRPLEALSRRGAPLLPEQRPSQEAPPAAAPAATAAEQDWPDDASFSINRWRRESGGDAPRQPPPAPSRAVPRSSRRRPA